MINTNKSLSLLAVAGLMFAPAIPMAFASDVAIPVKVVSPLKAASFDIGSKHALAYYQGAKEACKVTVVVSDAYRDDAPVSAATVRFNMSVLAGTSARMDTLDGPSLAFTCAPQARTLMIQTIDRVAYRGAFK
jgi:hypothetical protein